MIFYADSRTSYPAYGLAMVRWMRWLYCFKHIKTPVSTKERLVLSLANEGVK